MAKANAILLNSVLWNLREISKLADVIKKNCGDVDCTSWRYPSTSCSQLEIFKLLQSNRNLDKYTYILELTYDRLLYVFNLIIKYMESYDSLENFRPERNVRRPNTLSLASVLFMIWDRIRDQMEKANEEVVKEEKEKDLSEKEVDVKISKSSTFTQSDISSIAVCSCCEMVQEFVTQLVFEIESILKKLDCESAITAERKVMSNALDEMNNWAATSKWLEAIAKDLNVISEKSEREALSSRELRHRLEADERKMKTKIEQYEEEIRLIESRTREHESKISLMKSEMEKLAKEKNQLVDEVNVKDSQIKITTLNLEKKIEEVKKNYAKKLTKKKEEGVEKEARWKKKLECETKRKNELEFENSTLENSIKKLEQDLETANSARSDEKNALELHCQELENELKNLKEENSNLNLIIVQKQNIVDDYSRRIMEAFPPLTSNSKTAYIASGNPEIDMENQIEANNLRISSLQTENEQLRKALNKMKILKG